MWLLAPDLRRARSGLVSETILDHARGPESLVHLAAEVLGVHQPTVPGCSAGAVLAVGPTLLVGTRSRRPRATEGTNVTGSENIVGTGVTRRFCKISDGWYLQVLSLTVE